MDYEKKYKEALGWMQSLYSGLHGATKEDAEHYFPELKESEDDRMRKNLYKCLRYYVPNDIAEEYIKWLEKQGEKKNTHKREIDDAYLQGVCDAKHEIEKQGKKIDTDMVIAWLVANICDFDYYVKLFKKDFGL